MKQYLIGAAAGAGLIAAGIALGALLFGDRSEDARESASAERSAAAVADGRDPAMAGAEAAVPRAAVSDAARATEAMLRFICNVLPLEREGAGFGT